MKSKEQQHRTKNSTPKTFNHKNKLNNKEEEQPTKLKLKNKEQDCTTINKHTIRTHTNPTKNKEHNQRLARRGSRACCAGGRRTTGGTGHRRCFRQRRRAAISSSECAGGPLVESGELGRPHSVSRGLMQYMHLMSAHSGLLTHAADAPRRKTKKTHCVSIS